MVSLCPVRREPAEENRTVETPGGPITYRLVRKRVKNLNLRISAGDGVTLSVPYTCSAGRADKMVEEKWRWITEHLVRSEQAPELPPLPSRQECGVLLSQALGRVYPLVAPLGVDMPELKLRAMRSQWGNCHWRQGYITLNTALARCPQHLRDYVALHELVHFLHHDHGPGFYARMDCLMPEWRGYRKELKGCAAALERDQARLGKAED